MSSEIYSGAIDWDKVYRAFHHPSRIAECILAELNGSADSVVFSAWRPTLPRTRSTTARGAPPAPGAPGPGRRCCAACSRSMSSPVPAVAAGCGSSPLCRTRPSCGPSLPTAGARSPLRRRAPPHPPRPRSGRLAARPAPRGVPLAGAPPAPATAPLRPLLDRDPAPAQDRSGSAGDREADARPRPPGAARLGGGGRLQGGAGPDLARAAPAEMGLIVPRRRRSSPTPDTARPRRSGSRRSCIRTPGGGSAGCFSSSFPVRGRGRDQAGCPGRPSRRRCAPSTRDYRRTQIAH